MTTEFADAESGSGGTWGRPANPGPDPWLPAIVAFDHLELLIMSSGINRLRLQRPKILVPLITCLRFPLPRLPIFGDHLALHAISPQAMGYPCDSRYLISAIFSRMVWLVLRSRPRRCNFGNLRRSVWLNSILRKGRTQSQSSTGRDGLKALFRCSGVSV
jgi:hypothetical protein